MNLHLAVQENLRTGEVTVTETRRDVIDRALLDQAATFARVFTLEQEAIHGPKVARSIARFAVADHQKFMATQIESMWEAQPFPRIFMMKSIGGTPVTPPGGISDSTVANRVLYSELVHADDASEFLEHVSTEDQERSLSGLVGDWVALIAHQEALISSVRPDICPSLTGWAGDQSTIFQRLGVSPQEQYVVRSTSC